MKTLSIIAVSLIIFLAELAGAQDMEKWPELSNIKSVSGRVATEKDINDGAAVFLLQSEGKPIGKPINIEIPQYAIHTDGDTRETSKVIIVQAEEAVTSGQKVLGAIMIKNGEFLAGLYGEFKLLGSSTPNE